MVDDGLAMVGTRALATTVFSEISMNILVAAVEGLK